MSVIIGVPDLISPSYFPAIAAVELGHFDRHGIDAEIRTVFPVSETFKAQRAGEIDLVAGSAHAALYVYPNWHGCRLLCALSQNMYWFLVVRSDMGIERGDLRAVEGLSIAAAPGPVDGLRQMLSAVGLDPEQDVRIVPPPESGGANVSFGVNAARALERGDVDAFWANGMGAHVAVAEGFGTVVIDARRGDGPAGSTGYTFPALIATEGLIESSPELVEAAVDAITSAQAELRQSPERARDAAVIHFPEPELSHIVTLVARDASFYEPAITVSQVADLNDFARGMGLLGSDEVDYASVVAPGVGN